MPKKVVIELKDVWKIYKMDEVEVPALRGVNIKIYSGEFVSVMGASGSGKSTCLNMIGSLDIPTRGQVFLDGKDISKLEESDLARLRGRKIGYIFQVFNLIPSLSAIENVELPLVFQGISNIRRLARARELLIKVGLGHRLYHKPSELSGGERQRVAIARALVNDPEVLLADEPTGNLDSKTGQEVLALLDTLHKEEKRTIILVTHDQTIGNRAERIIKLKDGNVIEEAKR
ncbi:ABC transporter ATP-binding protein [Candidatus Woesearchaeota archaeon]|nr:ABC transporter ATP-binding protein [Candidatus Woesearchaeota archaeon]